MSITDFVRLIRPFNCIIAAIACYAGYAIALEQISFSFQIAFGMISVFLICGGGQAINDFFDRRIDVILHPEKPIPSGKIKPKNALVFSLLLFVVGVLISALLPVASTLIAIVFSLLLVFYSALIQKLKFLGNFVVALGTAFTIIFGAAIVSVTPTIILLAVSAFLSNVAREIIKDFEDMHADRGKKISLAVIFPKRVVQLVVLFFYALAIVTVYLPFFFGFFGNVWYIFLVSIANAIFIYSFILVIYEKYDGAQLASKAGMIIALIAFLSGVF